MAQELKATVIDLSGEEDVNTLPVRMWGLRAYNEPDLQQEPGICLVIEDGEYDIEISIPLRVLDDELAQMEDALLHSYPDGDYCYTCGGYCRFDAEVDAILANDLGYHADGTCDCEDFFEDDSNAGNFI